ncbi:MAG: hypothetical protein PHQ35_11295 [Phycisphaerae bacterium]|nr:hypothetical protein [Phycisphaerae bacterium]
MITPLRYDTGKLVTIRSGTASSTTITKFDLLDWASGYLQRATSSSTEVRLMAMEDVTTAAGAHTDILVLILEDVECEGDTNSTAAVTHRGTYIDLTDHDTLNEAASTTDVFYVTEYVSTSKLRGYFVHNIA